MRYSPYDETIFMDADILIINPIDALWDIFADCGDVSAFGCKLQLNSKKGWFTYEGSGKYKPRIHYLISMNGGIYYIKKGSIADSVFRDTEDVIREYSNIDFKYFLKRRWMNLLWPWPWCLMNAFHVKNHLKW